MIARVDLSHLPPSVVDAFDGKPSLSLAKTAAAIGMHARTLQGHVDAGNIGYIVKGLGAARKRREFTLANVAGFYAKVARIECPSTSTPTAPGITTTSGGEVVDFLERRKRAIDERQKRSNEPSESGSNAPPRKRGRPRKPSPAT